MITPADTNAKRPINTKLHSRLRPQRITLNGKSQKWCALTKVSRDSYSNWHLRSSDILWYTLRKSTDSYYIAQDKACTRQWIHCWCHSIILLWFNTCGIMCWCWCSGNFTCRAVCEVCRLISGNERGTCLSWFAAALIQFTLILIHDSLA